MTQGLKDKKLEGEYVLTLLSRELLQSKLI